MADRNNENRRQVIPSLSNNEPPFKLAGRAVHVWSFVTCARDDVTARLERLLDAEEMKRALRFRRVELRRDFVVARATLRLLLGRYLGTSPASIRFFNGANGKPALPGASGLDFNVSHSGERAVFAFTAGCPLGVDVEQIREFDDMQALAERFFCRDESIDLQFLAGRERVRAFFECWTRKEAYLKAMGDGLSVPLDSFRVTLRPDESPRLLHLANDFDAAAEWTMHQLRIAPGYAAALAYRDSPRPVRIQPCAEPDELIRDLLAGSSVSERPLRLGHHYSLRPNTGASEQP